MPRKNPETSPKESHSFKKWFETLVLRSLLGFLNVEVEVIVNGKLPADGVALFLLFPHLFQMDGPTASVGLAKAGREQLVIVVNGGYWVDRQPHGTAIRALYPTGVIPAPSRSDRQRKKQEMTSREQVASPQAEGVLARLRTKLMPKKATPPPREGTVKRMTDAAIHLHDLSLMLFPGGTRLPELRPAKNENGGFVLAAGLWQAYGIDPAVYAVHIENALPIFGKKVDEGEIKRSTVMYELKQALKRKLSGEKHISRVHIEPMGKVSELQSVRNNEPEKIADELKSKYERYETYALSGQIHVPITQAEVEESLRH